MFNVIARIYRFVFARVGFFSINKHLFLLSCYGLGILNYENDKLSGEDNFIKKFLLWDKNDDKIVLDVGANIGLYSKKLKLLCDCLNIYAFEPHPRTFDMLQQTADNYKFIVQNTALSDFNGKLKIYDYKNKDGSQHASLYKNVITDIHKSDYTEWDIDVTTLDDFVIENNIKKIHLLKIDVEGNEIKVLQGAKKSLENGIIEVIQFEFNEMNVISRVFFKDFFDILGNYNLYRLLPHGFLHIKDYDPLICEIFSFQNIIAVNKNSSFAIENI